MKKIVLFYFCLFSILIFRPSFVNAQGNSYIESVYLSVNNYSNSIKFSSSLPNDTVYYDESKYYLRNKLNEPINNYEILVKLSETGLKNFGGGIDSISKVSLYFSVQDCPTMIRGALDNNTPFGKWNYDKELPPPPYMVGMGNITNKCFSELFKTSGIVLVELRLTSTSGSQTTVQGTYKLNLQRRPINKCELKIGTSTEANPKSLFNKDRITISGDKIDDGGLSVGSNKFKVLLDGKEFPFCGSVNRKVDCYMQNGDSFTADTQQSVGKHTVQVLQAKDNGIVLCSKSFTVNADGEVSPVPAFSSTDVGDDADKTINLSISTPTSLCDAVPDQYKAKCVACAGSGENAAIWTALGCFPTNVTDLAKKVFELFSGLLGLFIFYCIISNGLKVMISRDSADAMKKAQEAITSCIVGLLVLVFSVLFLRIVGVDILRLPGWS